MRVIVAGRLSRKVTDRDQTGFDSQERESVRWAEANGHTVVPGGIVADFKSGRSGLEARPKLRPWVTDHAKLAQYDGIVALKVDRLTRGDRAETAKLEQWAREHNKALLIAGADVHFPSEGNEGIQWDLMLRMAHQEWLNTSERYRRMQHTLRESGYLVGRAPYGLRIVPKGLHKTLASDPVEAKVIQDAADWYLAGDTLDAICDRLNDSGRLPRQPKREPGAPFGRLRSGKPRAGPVKWVPKTLSGVLRSEAVAGRHTDARGGTLLKVTPILTRQTWADVIARMDARATRKGISQSKTPALLTSIIICGKCDRPMYRTGTGYYCRTTKQIPEDDPEYNPKKPGKRRPTCHAFIRLDLADKTVNDAMAADRRRDAVEVVTPASARDDAISEIKRDQREAVEAEDWDRLARLRAALDRLRALPPEPPRVTRKLADQTVAEAWAALRTDTEKRAYLLDRHATAVYEDGFLVVNLGQPERL